MTSGLHVKCFQCAPQTVASEPDKPVILESRSLSSQKNMFVHDIRSRHFETMGETATLVGIYRIIIIPEFFRWCRTSSTVWTHLASATGKMRIYQKGPLQMVESNSVSFQMGVNRPAWLKPRPVGVVSRCHFLTIPRQTCRWLIAFPRKKKGTPRWLTLQKRGHSKKGDTQVIAFLKRGASGFKAFAQVDFASNKGPSC